MSDTILPESYYDNLIGSFDHAWSLIEAGAKDRRSAFHTPAVSTIAQDGSPQTRVLVLRHADQTQRLIRFNTDIRSPKVSEIATDSRMSVLLYDSNLKIQLRLSGVAKIRAEGTDVDEIWNNADRFARRCYMTKVAPSSISAVPTSGLPTFVEGRKPEEIELIPARANFGIILFEVRQIDWLYLATQGHRRARWSWRDDTWVGDWAIP